MSARAGQLPRLTSLRWFAALAVFACHVGRQVDNRPIYSTLGYAGVGIFFVLSGIVLTWSAPDDDTARRFYRRRFARIYPATMASGVLAVIIALTFDGRVAWSVSATILFVLLLQAWTPDPSWPVYAYNGPVWTLSCEAFFYALFPWLRAAMSRMSLRRLAAIAAAVVVISAVSASATSWSVAVHMPVLRVSEFIVGMVIGTGLRRGWMPRFKLAPALLAYGVLVGVATSIGLPWFVLLPGAVLVLSAAAGADLRGDPSWLTTRWPVYLGELSFCFYLVHEIVISQMSIAGVRGWALMGALPVAFAAAVALHHGVELPMQRRILAARLRQIAMPQPRQVAVAVSRHQTST